MVYIVRAVLIPTPSLFTFLLLTQTTGNDLDGLFASPVVDIRPFPFWSLVLLEVPCLSAIAQLVCGKHLPPKLHLVGCAAALASVEYQRDIIHNANSRRPFVRRALARSMID